MNDNLNKPSEEKNSKGLFGTTNRRVIAGVAAAAIATGGIFGAQALADSKPYRHLTLAAGDSGWHRDWRGEHGRFADLSDAEIEKRVIRAVRHIAIEIEATDEQETKIIERVMQAVRELRPLRAKLKDSRGELHDILLADNIDRTALDSLRDRRLADIDMASKSVVDVLADIAEILTPEQRRTFEERVREFRAKRHRWHRG